MAVYRFSVTPAKVRFTSNKNGGICDAQVQAWIFSDLVEHLLQRFWPNTVALAFPTV